MNSWLPPKREAQVWVGKIALEEDFSLNHQKTHCGTAGQRQLVCSMVVNQLPNLPRPEFDRLKAILHQCVTQDPAAQNREGHAHWREHLHGRVAWAMQLNPIKGQRLKKLLVKIDWAR
jgi:RNA-directed DNA polymerase